MACCPSHIAACHTTSRWPFGSPETTPGTPPSPMSSQRTTSSSEPASMSMSVVAAALTTSRTGSAKTRCVVSDLLSHAPHPSQGCSLSALLESLQQLFSNDPPVYSKQKEDDPPPSDAARPPLPNKPMMRPPTVDPNRMTNPVCSCFQLAVHVDSLHSLRRQVLRH